MLEILQRVLPIAIYCCLIEIKGCKLKEVQLELSFGKYRKMLWNTEIIYGVFVHLNWIYIEYIS